MTAVDSTRLRFQSEALMADFDAPAEFRRQLNELFEMYSNRVLQTSDSTLVTSLIPMYHLPPPVFRQLDLDIKPLVNAEPEAALSLADELWTDPYFEVRRMAVYILSIVPVATAAPILTRLKNWLALDLSRPLKGIIFSTGTLRLQESFPEDWESFLQSYLPHENPKLTALGIQGLRESVKQPDFKNHPTVFKLISPFILNPEDDLIKELTRLIEVMVAECPIETAYFLKHNLTLSRSAGTKALVRRCLPLFPEGLKQDLKVALGGA